MNINRRSFLGGLGASLLYPSVSKSWTHGKAFFLDSLSPTFANSMSRKLISSYTANSGAFYHTTSSNVDTLYDQTSANNNFSDSTLVTHRPSVATAGPNNVVSALFNGSSNFLTGSAISSLITPSNGYIIATALITTVTLNNTLVYQNDMLFGDVSQFMGTFLKNNGPTVYGFNWDGNADSNNTPFSLNVPHVFEWRHEGNVVYQSVDGVEVQAASGDTATMTGALELFGRGAQFVTGNLFEIAGFATVPDVGNRTLLRTNFGNYVGAAI